MNQPKSTAAVRLVESGAPKSGDAKTKISFESISKIFALRPTSRRAPPTETVALADFNLEVKEGEFLVVVGPSGCGKSTLMDLVMGLSAPTLGRVMLDGKQITGPALDRGIVFQHVALLPWRTALSNIEFGLEAKKVDKTERTEIARKFLRLVGLDGFENHFPGQLSGGMRQRVAIARSLAYNPGLLIMDEPFAALDAQTRDTLQEELVRIWEASRKTIIFITHSIDEAVYLGQRVVVMTSRPGRVKTIIEIPLKRHGGAEDVRSSQEFVDLRHRVWCELRDEVKKAQKMEQEAISSV